MLAAMIRVAAAEMPERAWHISAADPQNAAAVALGPAEAAAPYDALSISAGSTWQPGLESGEAMPATGQLCSSFNTLGQHMHMKLPDCRAASDHFML